MYDRNISVRNVIATCLWLIGIACSIIELASEVDIGEFGIVAAAAGATLNVRGFFCQLERRERNAFDLGRDHERGADVTSIR